MWGNILWFIINSIWNMWLNMCFHWWMEHHILHSSSIIELYRVSYSSNHLRTSWNKVILLQMIICVPNSLSTFSFSVHFSHKENMCDHSVHQHGAKGNNYANIGKRNKYWFITANVSYLIHIWFKSDSYKPLSNSSSHSLNSIFVYILYIYIWFQTH